MSEDQFHRLGVSTHSLGLETTKLTFRRHLVSDVNEV